MSVSAIGLVRDTGNDKLDVVLDQLFQYDFSIITKSCIDRMKWSQEKAEQEELETKRFFSLALLDPGHFHIPSPDLDEYWHRMILHTVWYHDFCNEMFGEYFHHTPEPDDSHLDQATRDRTINVFRHWYGYSWDSLVKTCTQCKSTDPTSISSLAPSTDAIYKG